MRKRILGCYIVLFCAVVFFVLFMWVGDLGDDVREQYSDSDYTIWSDYTVSLGLDASYHVKGSLASLDTSGCILSFYSVHQNVTVYVDGELIYQYPLVNNNPLADSPGYHWSFIPLPDGARELEIAISSPYDNYADKVPELLIGTPYAVFAHLLSSLIVPFLLCIIIFCLGIVMIAYWLFVSRKVQLEKNLLTLGIFALFLSVWSINECQLTQLLLHNNIICSYFAFLSLMLLPFVFSQFVRTFYHSDLHAWDVFDTVSIVQIALCLILQLLRIADLRETLWTTHLMILALALLITYCSVLQVSLGIHTKRVIFNVGGLLFCVAAMAVDMITFYLGTWDGNGYGRIGFLIYITLMAVASIRESTSLMKIGVKASTYHQLAYTDWMTGLLNRAAFNRDTEQFSESPEHIAFIDFDLNNLKKTNDTHGHTAGDRYITDAAKLIEHIFGGVGSCYRMGGDEFAVLVSDCTELDIPHYLSLFEWSMDTYNRENRMPFRMQVAYGYAIHEDSDVSLEATYNRADSAMYDNKKKRKSYSHSTP